MCNTQSPSVVQRIPPWRRQGRRTVDHVAPSSEADIASRVRCAPSLQYQLTVLVLGDLSELGVVYHRSEVGYEFPPVMSKMIEANVQRRWQKWKERG